MRLLRWLREDETIPRWTMIVSAYAIWRLIWTSETVTGLVAGLTGG